MPGKSPYKQKVSDEERMGILSVTACILHHQFFVTLRFADKWAGFTWGLNAWHIIHPNLEFGDRYLRKICGQIIKQVHGQVVSFGALLFKCHYALSVKIMF